MPNLNEEDIFRVAAKIDSQPLRELYLDQVCGENSEMRQRLRLLMDADGDDSKLLGIIGEADDLEAQTISNPNEKIEVEGFEIIRKLGEGGMGEVYLAEQVHPIRRKVALKLLGVSHSNPEAASRFESEKQILANLNHPNVASIYAAGTTNCGRPYVAMEWIDGIPITEYCDDHQLSIKERLKLFRQACNGVQHAHFKGIIHRDLKPSNILVLKNGHQVVPKIIDFGIAKTQESGGGNAAPITRATQLIGTLEYMSPEQALTKHQNLDTRSDVYSLGVILHELLVGQIPFSAEFRKAESLGQKLALICESVPPSICESFRQSEIIVEIARRRQTFPSALAYQIEDDLRWIVAKTLEKEPENRYPTVQSFSDDIANHLESRPTAACPPSFARKTLLFSRRHPLLVTITLLSAVMIAMTATTVTYAYRESVKRMTREAELLDAGIKLKLIEEAQKAKKALLPNLQHRIDARQPVAAFTMARSLKPILGDDPDFQNILDKSLLTASFTELPPGTTVSICDSISDSQNWWPLGETPLIDADFPDGLVRVRFENEGYVTREYQLKVSDALGTMATKYLVPKTEQKREMVWVHGNQEHTGSSDQILQEFWIDRYEVSNSEYQEFVDAGGYEAPDLWSNIAFRKDDKKITWAEAMELFRDQTGQPGPATWKNGRYPPGKENYPVSGVSWYEANAYAAFRSKRIPTMHHWKWAASTDQPGITASQSNFASRKPQQCGKSLGIGRFDARDMAGNVAEWCWNEDEQGDRYILGGDWESQEYSFSELKVRSPWDRSNVNGFRCSIHPLEKTPSQESIAAVHHPPDLKLDGERKSFEGLRAHYLYDRNIPLEPETIATPNADVDQRKYRRETVEINAAYDQERFRLHLFIPRGDQKSLETMVFVPGVSAWENGGPFQAEKLQLMRYVIPQVEKGRLVCFPIYKGTYERWGGNTLPQQFSASPIQARNDYIKVSMDVSRAVDYLLTRDAVDPERLIYFGLSNGAIRGPMCLSTDPRLKAAILLAGGYTPWHRNRPEIQPYQFTPHVKQPTLMINGSADQVFPLETSQKTMFRDLGSTNKRHALFPADHLPDEKDVYRVIDEWLTNEAFAEN
ncbi:MAG: protein kinase [Planctomycetaceae bacterium]|nr:protein kinase [Planctomycetaceae bacterium]